MDADEETEVGRNRLLKYLSMNNMFLWNCSSGSLTTYSVVILGGWIFKAPFEWVQILKNNGPSTVILIKHEYNFSTMLKKGLNLYWPDLFNESFKFPKQGNSRA